MIYNRRRTILALLGATMLLSAQAASAAELIRIGLPTKTYWPTTVAEAAKAQKLFEKEGIAAEIGSSVGQMAIAWALKNPRVSTVITGASNLGQLRANLLSVDVVPRLTPEILARIDAIAAPLAQ